MAAKKDHPSTRILNPAETFYADQNPVNAITLAIEDHRAYAGGLGQVEFTRQLQIARGVFEELAQIKTALDAALCVVNLNQVKGVQTKWPEGTDGPDGPDYAEIERLIKNALVLLHFR